VKLREGRIPKGKWEERGLAGDETQTSLEQTPDKVVRGVRVREGPDSEGSRELKPGPQVTL